MHELPPAPRCPYCRRASILVSDAAVYKRSYGRHVWLCPICRAYVGCHKGGFHPLGRLANADLRALKVQAHALFDPYWQAATKLRGWSRHKARRAAYAWLADEMGIPMDQCHIGYFGLQETQLVIDICMEAKAHKGPTEGRASM